MRWTTFIAMRTGNVMTAPEAPAMTWRQAVFAVLSFLACASLPLALIALEIV